MKAIQIKFLPPTDQLSPRLKAWAEGCPAQTMKIDGDCDYESQARELADKYLKVMGWYGALKISGFGSLSNGDWVATLESIK